MSHEMRPIEESDEFGEDRRASEAGLNIGEMAVEAAIGSHQAQVSRRKLLRWGAGALLGITGLEAVVQIVPQVWQQTAPTLTVLSLKRDFDDMMVALPTDEQLRAQVPYLVDGRGRKITSVSLDQFQADRETSGPVNSEDAEVGISNNFGRGTMSDSGGPFNQPHSLGGGRTGTRLVGSIDAWAWNNQGWDVCNPGCVQRLSLSWRFPAIRSARTVVGSAPARIPHQCRFG